MPAFKCMWNGTQLSEMEQRVLIVIFQGHMAGIPVDFAGPRFQQMLVANPLMTLERLKLIRWVEDDEIGDGWSLTRDGDELAEVLFERRGCQLGDFIPQPVSRLRISWHFVWWHIWIGAHYDRQHRVLVINLLPCLGMALYYEEVE